MPSPVCHMLIARVLLTLAACIASVHSSAVAQSLRVVGSPENDVVRLLTNATLPWTLRLYPDLASALADSKHGDALLAMADANWPGAGLDVEQADYQAIAVAGVRAFLEAPSALPGDSDSYLPQPIDVFARAIVQGDGLASVGLRSLDVMQVQGFVGQVYPQEPYVPNALIVYAHVAGVDTAVYGLPPVSLMLPLLFNINATSSEGNATAPVLVSAAKLSDMIRDRFAPAERFQRVWSFIIDSITGNGSSNASWGGFPAWTPRVHPALNSTELAVLQAQVETQQPQSLQGSASPVELSAFQRATDWLASPAAGLLQVNAGPAVCPAPYAPDGADVVCMLEGYGSEIAWNGTQTLASDVRMDCVAETAMSFALRGWLEAAGVIKAAAGPDNADLGAEPRRAQQFVTARETAWRRRDLATGALVLQGFRGDIRVGRGQKSRLRSQHSNPSTPTSFPGYAAALLNYTWLYSEAMQGPQRGNMSDPAYGVMAWGVSSPGWLACQYGDDNARVIQAAALAHVILRQPPFSVDTAAWDVQLLRTLLANVRLTSVNGYRPGRINYVDLEAQGWAAYANSNATYGNTVWPQPHYQAQLWQTYLWAFARTGFQPFYDKVAAGIADMMAYYPASWHYTEYLSEEQTRLLHTLAWLVRADSLNATANASGAGDFAARSQHLTWLNMIADDILARQTRLGGVQEQLGADGLCDFCVPASNLAYGSQEAPVTQTNNDTCTDQLYSNNFLLLSLWEAFGATGDAQRLGTAANRIALYLAAIQAVSDDLPQVSGSWPRAFDYSRWEYWGSSSDMGWGAFSVESGWTTTWIAAGLGLRARGAFLWDLMTSDNNGIDSTLFATICPEFFDQQDCNV